MELRFYFPDPIFGWVFFIIITAFLLAASYTDFRWFKIPNLLCVILLALGVIIQVIRGVILAMNEKEVWLLGLNGSWVGGIDGFLFAMAGFAVGFGIFFALWMVGAVRGGDVKLFAAVSAWFGPYYSLWIYLGSAIILIFLSFFRMIGYVLTKGPTKAKKQFMAQQGRARTKKGPKEPTSRLMTYSFPLAVSTVLLTLWFFRYDLELVPPQPESSEPGVVSEN